jgi:hypothetical protein
MQKTIAGKRSAGLRPVVKRHKPPADNKLTGNDELHVKVYNATGMP